MVPPLYDLAYCRPGSDHKGDSVAMQVCQTTDWWERRKSSASSLLLLIFTHFVYLQLFGCESWAIKKAEPMNNWCFPAVVLEKILESPLDCKKIQPVHPKGNQSWIFTGRTDIEAETPIFRLPAGKNWLIIRKDPDAGKEWRQEEKGLTEDDMVGRHHRLNGHELEQIPGNGEGQGSLAGRSPWGCKKSDKIEQLNNQL